MNLARYVALVAYTHRAVVPLMDLGGQAATTSMFFGLDPRHGYALRTNAAGVAAEERVRSIRGVILDECSMVGVHQLRNIEKRLRTGHPHTPDGAKAYGGVALLVCGDYAQHRCLGDVPVYQGWADGGPRLGLRGR